MTKARHLMNSTNSTPQIHREKTLSDSTNNQESVRVFCRLKPLKDDEESTCTRVQSPTTLVLTSPSESKGIYKNKEVHCKFNHIFSNDASQEEVFMHVAYPLLGDLLRGKNGLLFTYGVTTAGKTYTLTGDHSNPGIMPKCIHTLFNTISDCQAPRSVIKSDKMNGFEFSEDDIQLDKITQRSPWSARKIKKDQSYINDGIEVEGVKKALCSVFVNYIEIYNNVVFDLLDETDGKNNQAKIVREDAQRNMYVNGVAETEVKSAEEAFKLFNMGQRRKRMCNTILNSLSSRSHSIFNIRVVQLYLNDSGDGTHLLKVAQLSLVDLAGSERTSRTQHTGQLLKEASQINNSLSTLRWCLEILRKNQMSGTNELVPYRRSRLTMLFKNYFEGQGTVSMIVCVNPSVVDFEENLQVMYFAETTQDVKITRNEAKYTPCKRVIQKKTKITRVNISNIPCVLLPELSEPKLTFTSYEETQTALDAILNVLTTRAEKVPELESELEQRVTYFSKRLETDDDKSVKTQLWKKKQNTSSVESKLTSLELSNKELISKNQELQNEVLSLHKVVAEKDLELNAIILENEKQSLQLDANLKRPRECTQSELNTKENKIQKLSEFHSMNFSLSNLQNREPLHEYDPQQTPPSKKLSTSQPAARKRRSRSAEEVLRTYFFSGTQF